MKKEIFKVCALGLIVVTIVTGCGKNEKGVNNITAKEEFVQSSERQNDNKVVKVDMESEQINDETFRLFINATTKDGDSVWKIELGNVPYGIGLENWISYQGKNNYYFSTNSEMSSYDIETGKELWTIDRNFGGFITNVEEQGNELHVAMKDNEDEESQVIIINTKDGSIIK